MKFKYNRIYNIKILFLYLFVFSLPFEYWDPFGIRDVLTVTKFAGLLYFILSLAEAKINFRFKSIKKPLITLLALWTLMFVQSVFNDKYGNNSSVFNFTFLQGIVLFWLVANDISRNNKLLGKMFLSLILGVFLIGVFASFGIGLENQLDREIGTFRITMFGSNPNQTGDLAAAALLFTVEIILNKEKYFGKYSTYLIFFLPIIIMLLSITGSRGAMLTALVSIITLLLFQKKTLGKKILMIFIGGSILIYSAIKVMETEIVQQRLQSSLESDGFGGRTEIWNAALKIFYDSPLFGHGVTGYEYEMLKSYGVYANTHNIFLYFMVTTGIIGLLLYMKFLYHLYNSAKRMYFNRKDVLLFAIFIFYIISVSRSGYALGSKLYWLLAAIIFSFEEVSNKISKRTFFPN